MANYEALKAEILADPLGRGYAGMTDQQAADDLNTEYRTRNRESMSASEVLNSVDVTEFNALTAENQTRFWQLMGLGTLDPFGVESTLMVGMFGGGSATITTLAGLRIITLSRAAELNLAGVSGSVSATHVANARAI